MNIRDHVPQGVRHLPQLDTPTVHRALRAVVRPDLAATADRAVVGGLVRVSGPDGPWEATAGSAEIDRHRPIDPAGSFRIGSITKPFVATVVLGLVADGRLTLDEPVQRRAAGLLPADYPPISVRQLLQHTSGIPNYLPLLDLRPERLPRERHHGRTPEELCALAFARPRTAAPGAELHYSNTNYLLLGQLVQRVTGVPWEAEVSRRVIEPLGLTGTFTPGADPDLPRPHARGYARLADGRPVDVTEVNPSIWGAAGSMISTAPDLDTFLAALLEGRLLPPTLLEEMLRVFPGGADELPPTLAFGLGTQRLRLPEPLDDRFVHGGGGGVPGFVTMFLGTRDGQRRTVLHLTLAARNEMTAVEPLLHLARAVFCGRLAGE